MLNSASVKNESVFESKATTIMIKQRQISEKQDVWGNVRFYLHDLPNPMINQFSERHEIRVLLAFFLRLFKVLDCRLCWYFWIVTEYRPCLCYLSSEVQVRETRKHLLFRETSHPQMRIREHESPHENWLRVGFSYDERCFEMITLASNWQTGEELGSAFEKLEAWQADSRIRCRRSIQSFCM